jgi:hypothetical protein
MGPFQNHNYLKSVVAPGMKRGTSGYVARNSDHKTIEMVENLLLKRIFGSKRSGIILY